MMRPVQNILEEILDELRSQHIYIRERDARLDRETADRDKKLNEALAIQRAGLSRIGAPPVPKYPPLPPEGGKKN